MVILTNIFGEHCGVPAQQWEALLASAQQRGWQPAGTRRPAVTLGSADDDVWNESYYPPCGQEITRTDAAALSRVLAAIAEEDEPMRRTLGPLTAFLQRSGCLLRRGAPDSGSLLNLLHATGNAVPFQGATAAAAVVEPADAAVQPRNR